MFNIRSYGLVKNLRYGLLIKKVITNGRTREHLSRTRTQYLSIGKLKNDINRECIIMTVFGSAKI